MSVFHSTGSFMKRVRDDTHLDPVRDWLIVCILSVTILAGIIAWNAWAFNTVAGGGVIGTPVADTLPVFDRSSLGIIHTIFNSRAEEETKYRTGTYRYADPSQ